MKGICKKKVELNELMNEMNIDILLLQDTWKKQAKE